MLLYLFIFFSILFLFLKIKIKENKKYNLYQINYIFLTKTDLSLYFIDNLIDHLRKSNNFCILKLLNFKRNMSFALDLYPTIRLNYDFYLTVMDSILYKNDIKKLFISNDDGFFSFCSCKYFANISTLSLDEILIKDIIE